MSDTVKDVLRKLKKTKVGKGKKGRQSSHNKTTGRYERQKARTRRNKEKAWRKHLEVNPRAKGEIDKARSRLK